MNFTINNVNFRGFIDTDNKAVVKSYNKNYEVIYNNDNLSKLINDNYIENDFVIIDRNVFNLDSLCLNNINCNYSYIFDAYEDTKTIDFVLKITDLLYNLHFNKKNKLLVIGGGITQDVSGFAAAMYKRGLKWTFIPTTFLSMTDSCIGGKVGVNRKSKNMLALFYSPNNVIISDFFIKSLNSDDIISGIGEALKLSLIGGILTYDFFKENYNRNTNTHNFNYINLIKMSTSVKKIIIEHDELENSERKVLNYGHTFGHALESSTNYFIPHGIAVLYGMYIINSLFYDKYTELSNYILELIPIKFKKINITLTSFINALLNDKKNDGNKICFILLDEIGKTIFVFKTFDEIKLKLLLIFEELFIVNY